MDQAKQAQADYKALLSDLAEFEPHSGYQQPSDLPSGVPTDSHRALILRARPDLMNRMDLSPLALADLISQPQTSLGGRDHRLGMHLARELDAAIAHQLVSDLQEACEQRREIEEFDAAAERADRINPMLSDAVTKLFQGERG